MKKILIVIILLICSMALFGCDPQYVLQADTVPETVIVTETVIKEVENTEKIEALENEVKQYQNLLGNLDESLSNVYYVYQKKSDGSSSWGTGFSIIYDSEYYLITAGHIVDSEFGIFKNLGFKANFGNEWIYPKLLTYKRDAENYNDYAIFYSDKVVDGLTVDNDKDMPKFVLGNNYLNINILRNIEESSLTGESGSPMVDKELEVTGLNTTDLYYYFTDINTVLQAIDNIN